MDGEDLIGRWWDEEDSCDDDLIVVVAYVADHESKRQKRVWHVSIVKSYQNPQGNETIHFTTTQETVRKNVERAFGVLQAWFAMVCLILEQEHPLVHNGSYGGDA